MSSSDEYRFQPKLGRIRSRGGRKAKRYVNHVLQAAGLAGARSSFSRLSGKTSFTGARIGRGAVAGSRVRSSAFGRRRVVIKTRIVKMRGRESGAARAHLRYIQREAVGREGEKGRLYNAAGDEADGKAFLERGQDDRHQFRFIASPEDATEMADLKPFVRDLMAQMERDLGTGLDWVAGDHFNTDNPHSHIVLRGKDERGQDLVIARDYIAHGLRERACDLITLELGPKSENQIRDGIRREVKQERFTRLDRELIRDAEDGMVDMRREARGDYGRFKQVLHLGRLQRLSRMGLAEEIAPKRWRLSPELESRLRGLGERGDIIKTMHREMKQAGLDRPPSDHAIFDPSEKGARVVGRVVARGLSDELHERHYLIVDGLDGRTHYAEVGQLESAGDFEPGTIVALEARAAEPRTVDRTIARIAADHDGRYSPDLHRLYDSQSSDEFVRTHVRRLEALRRSGLARRAPDGGWEVPDYFLDKVRAFEERQSARRPARLTLLSSFALEAQVEAEGATWLDRQLVGRSAETMREAGFGRKATEAAQRRRRWLIEQGWAEEKAGRTIYRSGLLNALRQREIGRVASQLAGELGIPFQDATKGGRVEGIYRRPVSMVSGKFALIQKSHEFTLVPWRQILKRSRGKHVSGVMRGDRISWSLVRKRGLGVS